MNITKTLIRRVIILAIASQCILAAAQDCAKFTNSTNDELQQFLQQSPSSEDLSCTISAIRKLGENHVTGAAGTLSKYLDLEQPLTEGEKMGVVHHPRTVARAYPAVNALFDIGEPALPTLLGVLKLNDPPGSLRRSNAIRTIMMILIDGPSSVTLIRNAGRREPDPTAALSLQRAAEEAAQVCVPDEKAKCAVIAAGKE
jgi:hypothetical protein